MNLQNLFESQTTRSKFNIGDPVIITGNVQYRGKTGDVQDTGRNGAFVVVNLYNYGPHSFHTSDVSYNDYADSDDIDDEEDVLEAGAEGADKIADVEFDTGEKKRVRYLPTRRNIVDVLIKYYLRQGKRVVSVNGNPVPSLTVAEGQQKTFKVVYYSPKTDRNVTKTIKADNESDVWDQLKAKGVDVVSVKETGVSEGSDNEELANEVYREFERIYPNLARRADERTVHAAVMDVLNYGGDSNPAALAQDVARAVRRDRQGVAEGSQEEDPLELSSDYALYIANAGRHMMTQLANMAKKIQTDSTAAQNAKRWNLGDFMHQHYETDDINAINQVFEEYGVGGFFDQNLYELLAYWSAQGSEYVTTWKQYTGDVLKNSTRKPSGVVHEQGVSEASDISGLMTAASMVRDYIITAEVDGKTKRFRVRGMTGPRAARERFLKHASQARVVDVKPVSEPAVSEDAVADFLARGGTVQTGKYHRPRKSEKTDYGSRHIGGQRDAVAGKAGKTLGRAAATAFKGSGKPIVGEKAEKSNDQPWVDPKLKRRMDYAFGHYAGYKDKPEAFFKWVMNSIDHSEQNDQRHEERFERIEKELDRLAQRLSQVNEQHGRAVANRFSQRLAERFAEDRPTQDPARQQFAESRARKRAAIREIFANRG